MEHVLQITILSFFACRQITTPLNRQLLDAEEADPLQAKSDTAIHLIQRPHLLQPPISGNLPQLLQLPKTEQKSATWTLTPKKMPSCVRRTRTLGPQTASVQCISGGGSCYSIEKAAALSAKTGHGRDECFQMESLADSTRSWCRDGSTREA